MPELNLPIRARGAFVKILVRIPGGGRVYDIPLNAFLDTGASDTMVDIGLIESLHLEPCHQVGLNILGRTDPGYYETFQIEVALLGHDATIRWIPLTVLGGPCFQTGAAVALGRDFLRHHRLDYDGLAGKAKLTW